MNWWKEWLKVAIPFLLLLAGVAILIAWSWGYL